MDKHDFFPKLTLGGWIGDRYPLCKDLPSQHFLKIGAQYHLRGGSSVPSLQSMSESWKNGDENVKRFVLSSTSNLYQKLCNADADGNCQYLNTVHIEENLPCDGKECRVDTVVIVQVAHGVFYEYIRQPCVHNAFQNDARKVVTGIKWTTQGGQYVSTNTLQIERMQRIVFLTDSFSFSHMRCVQTQIQQQLPDLAVMPAMSLLTITSLSIMARE